MMTAGHRLIDSIGIAARTAFRRTRSPGVISVQAVRPRRPILGIRRGLIALIVVLVAIVAFQYDAAPAQAIVPPTASFSWTVPDRRFRESQIDGV